MMAYMQQEQNTISVEVSNEKMIEVARLTGFLDGYAKGVFAVVEATKNHVAQGLISAKKATPPQSVAPKESSTTTE